jgi:hypothetical protein
MSLASETSAPIRHADRFFIGGQWRRRPQATLPGSPARREDIPRVA